MQLLNSCLLIQGVKRSVPVDLLFGAMQCGCVSMLLTRKLLLSATEALTSVRCCVICPSSSQLVSTSEQHTC